MDRGPERVAGAVRGWEIALQHPGVRVFERKVRPEAGGGREGQTQTDR